MGEKKEKKIGLGEECMEIWFWHIGKDEIGLVIK